jgi:tetratricopeptide (TPR) repeat protein
MFEIGRELRRFFAPPRPRDGLSLGDASLLELLDLNLLKAEARAADVAAGRIGVLDKAERLIEASAVHLELARRTGDPAALRKAASCAQQAADIRRDEGRSTRLGQARCAQARIALVGADLFGEDGLNGAANFLVSQVQSSPGAQALQARLAARSALSSIYVEEIREAARRFDPALASLTPKTRASAGPQAWAELLAERAEFLMSCGRRLHETQLLGWALTDLDRASSRVDEARLPLTAARLRELRGLCLLGLGELEGDIAKVLDAVDALTAAVELIEPSHSPLDWARARHGLGLAFVALGEAGASASAFDRAAHALAGALTVVREAPSVRLRTVVVQDRAACLARRAEVTGDVFALDEAEAALRSELAGHRPALDPVGWAVLQLNLARLYLARAELRGADHGERSSAGEALSAALEVFAEKGLRSLSVEAEAQLERVRRQGRTGVP